MNTSVFATSAQGGPAPSAPSTTQVDPATWRQVDLTMPDPNTAGDSYTMQLLEPLSWIAGNDASVGNWISLNLPELQISGEAQVTSIDACPTIESGSGQVVLGTFQHISNDVVDVKLAGESQPLQVTSGHKLWSMDADGWVAAGSLYAGERLASENGPVVVESVTPTSQPMEVYNLDVENDHRYLVTDLGVLAHNLDPCPSAGDGLNVVRRPGMAEQVITDKNGDAVTIYGQSSSSSETPGHAETIEAASERLAKAGEVKYVTMQRSVRTATGRMQGASNIIPDITVVNDNGTVDMYEVPSASQDTEAGKAALLQKLQDAMNALPAANRGKTDLIEIKQ